MSMKASSVLLGLVVAGLISMASAVSGTATYYDKYKPSACYENEDKGVMITAVGPEIYDDGAACGRTYTVRCTGPTNRGVPHPCRGHFVTVEVVDLCPECSGQWLDLSKEAFSQIAHPKAGKIKIEYS